MTAHLVPRDTSRLYLIEIRSEEGEAQLIKSNLPFLEIGRDPACTIVLSDKMMAPVQLRVEFAETQVQVRNRSEAISVECFPTGVLLNGTATHNRRTRQSAPGRSESGSDDDSKAWITPGDTKPWMPDTTLAVGRYLLTLRCREEPVSQSNRRCSSFQVLQDRLLPDMDLMRPRLAGLNVQQLMRAWWLLTMLFAGGGIITYVIFRYLPMLRLATP